MEEIKALMAATKALMEEIKVSVEIRALMVETRNLMVGIKASMEATKVLTEEIKALAVIKVLVVIRDSTEDKVASVETIKEALEITKGVVEIHMLLIHIKDFQTSIIMVLITISQQI